MPELCLQIIKSCFQCSFTFTRKCTLLKQNQFSHPTIYYSTYDMIKSLICCLLKNTGGEGEGTRDK